METETIEVNGKKVYIRPTKSTFNRTATYFLNIIYASFSRIGIDKKYIDIPLPKNTLKIGEEARISWIVNGQDYTYSSNKQNRFIDNLGVLAKVIQTDCYSIRNGLKPFGMVMSQFRLGYSEEGEKIQTPREILGLAENIKDIDYIIFRYKQKCKETHPDNGGKTEDFQKVNEAYNQLKEELEKVN